MRIRSRIVDFSVESSDYKYTTYEVLIDHWSSSLFIELQVIYQTLSNPRINCPQPPSVYQGLYQTLRLRVLMVY